MGPSKCKSSNLQSAHVRVHGLSPTGAIDSHQPNDGATGKTDKTKDGKQPAVANGADDWGGHKGAHTGKNISNEVIKRDTLGRFLWHELGKHSGDHAEDEHGAHAEEEVGDHL